MGQYLLKFHIIRKKVGGGVLLLCIIVGFPPKMGISIRTSCTWNVDAHDQTSNTAWK